LRAAKQSSAELDCGSSHKVELDSPLDARSATI
jgi:hypothetical protein